MDAANANEVLLAKQLLPESITGFGLLAMPTMQTFHHLV
jgi:hypothetical protein